MTHSISLKNVRLVFVLRLRLTQMYIAYKHLFLDNLEDFSLLTDSVLADTRNGATV